MMKNNKLYNAAMALVECSKFVKEVDEDFFNLMLDKAEEMMLKIDIDEDLEKEIDSFKERIEKEIN